MRYLSVRSCLLAIAPASPALLVAAPTGKGNR
jgi:hypothetical protein